MGGGKAHSIKAKSSFKVDMGVWPWRSPGVVRFFLLLLFCHTDEKH